MAKQWGLEWTDDINCEENCAFGSICEARGSNYLYVNVIKESDDEDLKNVFENCGVAGTLSITFLPIVSLKKGRF
jgi:hypothetical protein